jgi:hypothetical protein
MGRTERTCSSVEYDLKSQSGVPPGSYAMPCNTNILLIRHAEVPDGKGAQLSVSGEARAQAYTSYFKHLVIGKRKLRYDHLFAAADSAKSHRPRLTITPLAQACNQPIKADISDDRYQQLADEILKDPSYDEADIMICWHHGRILELAHALGVRPHKLTKHARWPHRWPNHVFGWNLQLRYDTGGQIIPDQTTCFNQRLMHGDHGMEPPNG